MASVLVTGGAGYIGSVCSQRLLEQGHQVTVVDDLSTGHAAAVPAGATFCKLNIANRSELGDLLANEEFDAVFHFAAKALIPESVSNPGVFFDANVASGVSLLETVRGAGIKRFVFSSSAAVYGNPQTTPIVEEHSKNPVNSYGETKLSFERALYWYATAYGWTVVAFRYFNACGATATIGEHHQPETHIIPLLLQTAAGERAFFEIYGSDYETPDGTCLRDYVHVLDIAEAHILALQAPARPGFSAYNIGTRTSYSVLQVCQAVEAEVGVKLSLKHGSRRPGDPAVLCADSQKLMRDLGWVPHSSDLPTIIRTAWEWKKKNPQGYPAQPEQESIDGFPSLALDRE
jgi:UDP-glucose 4-epimerase